MAVGEAIATGRIAERIQRRGWAAGIGLPGDLAPRGGAS